MFNLVSPLKLISIVLVLFGLGAIAAIYTLERMQFSTANPYRAVMILASIYDLILLGFAHVGWRWLWRKIPLLSSVLFPDLNGEWRMTIHWSGVDGGGEVEASALIKQSFVSFSIEVQSDVSDSETLVVQPKKDSESGRPVLYYVYRVVPKGGRDAPAGSYEGTAILKFFEGDSHGLRGNYFTSRNTQGRFELQRA
ncbi:hypothetical protein ACTVZK_15420 [Pseudomonas aeruginosa]|uniref:CD-NTase-associated protein 15 domain-containing protein n=1 Tax=Stutzerimonas frequens TaxID=2968969 RepID=A0AA47DZM6_9GAMM|nr:MULTISPECIES: hypothetical protein [Stutzerimonas]WAE51501.1 hypothetical protein OSV15_17750 [Stutzerimonas frequens]